MDWSTKTLLLDNYDSFTWNLEHLLRSLGDTPVVLRPGESEFDDSPRRLIISPGPGSPATATVSMKLVSRYMGKIPILGVCLGHQCLAAHFGWKTRPLEKPCHGHTAQLDHLGRGLFEGIPNPTSVMRYHSLFVDPVDPRPDLEELAWCHSPSGPVMMAFQHRTLPVAGVQFHPESFLTESGAQLLENFLSWS